MEGDIARDIQSPPPPENGSKQLGRSLWLPSDAIWSSGVHIAWENNSSWWIPRQCHTQELHEDRQVTPVYRITQSCWAPVNQKQLYSDKTSRKSMNINFAQHHCATNFCICARHNLAKLQHQCWAVLPNKTIVWNLPTSANTQTPHDDTTWNPKHKTLHTPKSNT